jgi:prolyl oligopeptidase
VGTVMSHPYSHVEPVTEVLHGIPVSDHYRWLEDQNSSQTRSWIEAQTRYARAYLDNLPRKDTIRKRVQEVVDVETYDSFLKRGNHYFFRKRLPGQEQPCIYLRNGLEGKDQILVDPNERGTGNLTAVKPRCISPCGQLLVYEVKQGGERAGTFEILDVPNRKTLPDILPHGYLRGFAFAPDAKGFYYVHEATAAERPFYRAGYYHAFGTSYQQDREFFSAGDDKNLRLLIVPGRRQLGLLVYRFLEKTYTDFYIWRMGGPELPVPIVRDADYSFAPHFLRGRILALTDRNAPNRKIVEVQPRKNQDPLLFDLVPESDALIQDCVVTDNYIFVSRMHKTKTQIHIFNSFGKYVRQIPCEANETLRLVAASSDDDEILIERESFASPVETQRYVPSSDVITPWAKRELPLDSSAYSDASVSFQSKDGTDIPMFLFGRRELLDLGTHPVIMTAYGGYGMSMTPQFSAFVAFLVEHGCVLAVPNIRGGAEFGAEWHRAAKRRNRQVAFDDFLEAAEWLVRTGRTTPDQLAIFGGSNSGLLVAAAMTQRPDLFRAVVCLAPILDMLRYHLFDNSHLWKDEFGTADDLEDFQALIRYSPYHAIRDGVAYPATMIVSGDADRLCNALHARKMTARLQAANASGNPIFLDYGAYRGHSAVLPLSIRIDALTDRMAFLSDQLRLQI